MGKLRHRTGIKCPAEDHTVSNLQSWDLNLDILASETALEQVNIDIPTPYPFAYPSTM